MAERPAMFAVDLGTSKVLAAAAELGAGGEIRVTGVGVAEATGVRRGVVVDLGAAAACVAAAVERAQRMAGGPFGGVVLGVSGGSVQCSNERVGVDVSDPDEVSEEDMARVLAAARGMSPGEARTLVHAIPRHFILDGVDGIRHPAGLAGGRLEVSTHLVTAPAGILRNAVRTAERAGLTVAGVTLTGLAAAEAVTTQPERERGVMVVDLGAGCADVVILIDGAPVFTAVVPLGADLIRNDIAAGLHMSLERAEALKVEQGCCDAALADPERAVPLNAEPRAPWHAPAVPAGAGPVAFGGRAAGGPAAAVRRSVTEVELAEIVAARAEEILVQVADALRRSGCARDLGGGAVLTGGGSRLRGLPALAMRVLEMPVRTAVPRGCADVDDLLGAPGGAAAVGLLQLAAAGLEPALEQAAADPARRRRGLMDRLRRRR